MHSVPCSRRRDACYFAAVDLPLQCIVCAALVVAVHDIGETVAAVSPMLRCMLSPARRASVSMNSQRDAFVVPAVAPLYPCIVCPCDAYALSVALILRSDE